MKEHNISQPELAKEIGCSKSTISRFISGAKGTLTHEPVSYTHLKRCKDKALVGTVKETVMQVSRSKKWASKPLSLINI